MEDKIIEIAASIFGMDPRKLSIKSSRDEIEKWDSLAHVMLIAEIEEQFGVSIPFEETGNIHQLKDFLRYVGK